MKEKGTEESSSSIIHPEDEEEPESDRHRTQKIHSCPATETSISVAKNKASLLLMTVTMTFTYPKEVQTPMRSALIQMAYDVNATHDLTLCFNDYYRADVSVSRLAKWYRNMMQRLFGRRCYQLPKQQVIEFIAFPEFSSGGKPHFHCPIRIPGSHLNYFKKVAETRWKAIVPKGHIFLQPIRQTAKDYADLFDYVTKSPSAKDVIHSSMLMPIT